MDLCRLMFPSSYSEMQDCKSLFLVGNKGTCKTSLLLQMASTLSSQYFRRSKVDDDCTIMFICNYQLTAVPLHVHRMPQFDAVSAKNISIQYLKSYADLITYLANLIMHAGKLTGIIVDGIEEFLKTIDEKMDGNYKDCAAKLFALLVDLGGHYSGCQDGFVGGDSCCPVIVSFDSHPNQDITEKTIINSMGNQFFDQVVEIESCYMMGKRNGFRMADAHNHLIYFYIEEGQIYLHKIAKIRELDYQMNGDKVSEG